MRSDKPKLYWRIKDKQTQKWIWKAAIPIENNQGNTIGYGKLNDMKYMKKAVKE